MKMERWEALLKACPDVPDLRYFSKAIQTAGVVFEEDLAPFEQEWILQTLLRKPVNLIDCVTTKCSDDSWSKPIGDAFKLLADVIEKHTETVETYFEEIVDLCHLPLDATSRKQSLRCLRELSRVSVAGARDAARHIANLEGLATGKAVLAELVGTICEYHPETVADDFNKIWRIYLNLLDSNKNTDQITSSLLEGMRGLFKHFGTDLPTTELNSFYDKLVGDYIRIPKCEDVCLRILASHSLLFKERITADVRIRNYIWRALHNDKTLAAAAAIAVYKAVCDCTRDKQALQTLATQEVLPHTQSTTSLVRYTALRVVTLMRDTDSVQAHSAVDMHTLEVELREDRVPGHVADAIAWCIEANLPNSEKLLQAAIVHYLHLPASKRQDIVVKGILNAPSELRTAATNFLISESIVDSTSLENYLTLWRDLFQYEDKSTEEEKAKYVFEDFMSYVVFVLDAFVNGDVETLPTRLLTLITLTTTVVTLQPPSELTTDLCAALMPVLVQLNAVATDAAVVTACTVVSSCLEDEEFYQSINIERCKDEATLCASCLALIQAPAGCVDVANVLTALQIIFSRSDVEPKVLLKALHKFENILLREKDNLDPNSVHNIIKEIENIRDRKSLNGKDGRILHRDIVMFLGKYKTDSDINNNSEDNLIVVKLKDSLTLTLPNPEEGINYKINLQSIVQQALQHEDSKALQTLLVIMCASLSTKQDSSLQSSLSRVCHALSRSHAGGATDCARALQAAVAMCGNETSVRGLLHCISSEKSPGVRRMLSDALESVLSRQDDSLVSSLAEHAAVMLTSHLATTKRAGLNITETIVNALKDKNDLTTKIFPNILISIVKTYEIDSITTYEVASKHFLEKIELFQNDTINDTMKELMKILIEDGGPQFKTPEQVKTYKNISKIVLAFMKNVFQYKKEDNTKIIQIFLSVFEEDNSDFFKSLSILTEIKHIFNFDAELCKNLLSYKLRLIFQTPLTIGLCKENYFCIESAFKFWDEYAPVLLEYSNEITLQNIGNFIKDIKPKFVKALRKSIISCLQAYSKKNTPKNLITAYENWCEKIPLKDISVSINKELFTTEHAIFVSALKIMTAAIKFDISSMATLKTFAENCTKNLLRLYSNGYIVNYLKSKMAYLTDLLTLSVKFLTREEIKKIILEGSCIEGLSSEKVGVKFCRFFIHVFHEALIQKPYILLDEDMTSCSVLLNDIVKYTLTRKISVEDYENVLDLVNQLWPTYEQQTTFNEKHSLLLDLSNFPKKLDSDSNPLQWAVSVIASDASREEKARLIGVLPGGDAFSTTYRAYASILPSRLSELRGDAAASTRALLDALAATADCTLLDIAITLAGGDDTKGWWDAAIDSCMASLAQHPLQLHHAAYKRCWEGLDVNVTRTRRVLAPLLRYSTSSTCEEFFSSTLNELLHMKEYRTTKYNHLYHTNMVKCTNAFIILQIMFEKLPSTTIESPSSALYRRVVASQSWHAVRAVCKLALTLRDKITVLEDATDKFNLDYRQFQCANYNCISAAICKWKPDEKIYNKCLFDAKVWDALVDSNLQYELKIRHQWNQRTRRQQVSIDVQSATLTQHSGTVRTRLFLRTLSENPLLYDLIDDVIEEVETQDLHLTENELNNHECASTLTALVCHMVTSSHTQCALVLAAAVSGGLERNTRWLLAQVICNCKEELLPHANTFRGPLLELIATTATELNGKTVLNGLHVDILETIIHWSDDNPTTSIHLNTTIQHLITTCMEHRQHKTLFKTLTDVLGKLLDLYGSAVEISLSYFDGYLTDSKASETLKVLLRILKAKINIPELLPTLITKLESKQGYQHTTAELFGLALSYCDNKQQYLIRFRKLLEQLRKSSAAEYVRMLYYAQNGYPHCCDEFHFKVTSDLASKMIGAEKTKCLQILSTYISNNPYNETVSELYETIDLADMISNEHFEAFKVIKVGIKHMSPSMRKSLVMLTAGYCSHSLVKVRRMACAVSVAAADDLFTPTTEVPPAKKPKVSTSPIITTIQSHDVYHHTVVTALANGIIDDDIEVRGSVRDGVARVLSKDLSVRFTECFLLTIYLPATSNRPNLSVCVSALLDLLVRGLRGQERFKKLNLRDEPLETPESTSGPSKLLTMSKSYIGTFKPTVMSTGRRKLKKQSQDSMGNSPDIDVQMSLDSILETFLEFSNTTPKMAETFCMAFIQAIKNGRGFDTSPVIAKALTEILEKEPNYLTPFVVALCRTFIDDVCKCDNIQTAIQNLKTHTKNTEGEPITSLLYGEIQLRCMGHDYFVLGSPLYEDIDCSMDWESEFCIEDLTAAFAKLSNWDSLTAKEKRRIQQSDLPMLWTSRDVFKEHIRGYQATNNDWFAKMVSAYRQTDKDSMMNWLRDLDRWPRRHFAASAITEALEWQNKIVVENYNFPCDVQAKDCLVEWAARFMIRSAYLDSLSDSQGEQTNIALSRSHELLWCERANEMQLSACVMDCVKRNIPDLGTTETLPWLLQKLQALHRMGIQKNDEDILKKALLTAETYTPQFADNSSSNTVVDMIKMIMLLRRDSNSLSTEKIQEIFHDVDKYTCNGHLNKESLKTIYEIAIVYFDSLWENNTDIDQNATLSDMLDILHKTTELDINNEGLVAVILNRLDHCTEINGVVAKRLVEQIETRMSTIDEFSLLQLRSNSRLLPSRSRAQYSCACERDGASVVKYKRCLQLVCDAEYSLMHYCEGLGKALLHCDANEWKKVFDRMKYKIFENPYAGSDYQLLNKYKETLYGIYQYEPTPTFKTNAEKTLKQISQQLNKRDTKYLRMSQLCPALSRCDEFPGKLLGLWDNLTVVRFDEQVEVFTDSIRRPTVFKVLLSDGTSRRYLHKGGESLRVDAAAQRVVKYAAQLWGEVGGYNVIPLSEDDGLIEYLEDHERLRDLVAESCDIEAALTKVQKPRDQELVSTPVQALLSQYKKLCNGIPRYSLRDAIAKRSVNQQDLIYKMRMFGNTVGSSTIICWILGVGDRHLQNILYNTQDGGIRHIDWGAVFEYGCNELPPARLTGTILAVCRDEIEAKMQKFLTTLRDDHKLFSAIIKISFKWLEGFQDKYPYITSILRGTTRSCDVTRDVINASNMKDSEKNKYIELLDNVFEDFETKDQYTVEEQVSCLLRHCTDPQILSVVRRGWEAWV